MNMQFTEMKIGEMMERYPEALSVFRTNGFNANTKEDLIEELGPNLMLKTALMVKGINTSLFENMLEEKLSETLGLLPDRDGKAPEKPNFIGYTYCPLKHIFKECFDETLEKYLAETDDYDFTYFVPSGCGGDDPYQDLWKAEHIDELPDIIASVGFGDFFNQQFVDRFVSKGYFETVAVEKESDVFVSAGSGKRPILLFSYPVSRKKILLSKLSVVCIFTILSMVISDLLIFSIFGVTERFMPLVSETFTASIMFQAVKITIVMAFIAASIGIIAVGIGFMKKSVPTTIVSAVLLASLMCNIVANTTSNITAMYIFALIMMFIGTLFSINLIYRVNLMEVE